MEASLQPPTNLQTSHYPSSSSSLSSRLAFNATDFTSRMCRCAVGSGGPHRYVQRTSIRSESGVVSVVAEKSDVAERSSDLKALSLSQHFSVVMKFGGSSAAPAARMCEVADLILCFPDEKPIIVLSAMGKTTNNLLQIPCSGTQGRPIINLWQQPCLLETQSNGVNSTFFPHNLHGPTKDFTEPLARVNRPSFSESSSKTSNVMDLKNVIKTIKYYQSGCIDVPSNVLCQLLVWCIEENNVTAGREVYLLIVGSGLEHDVILGSYVIRMFTHFELLLEANGVFKKLVEPDLFTWTAIISANVKLGENEQAFHLYIQMLEASVEPDGHVFVEVLKACRSAATLKHGQQIHACIIERGLEHDAFVGSSLVGFYMKSSSLQDVLIAFCRLPNHDTVTWSTLMSGYIQHCNGKEALELFELMQQDGAKPDHGTLVCLFGASSDLQDVKYGRKIHNHILTCGIPINSHVGNALVDMYAKCGCLEDAQVVFDKLCIQDIVAWSCLISGYAQNGNDQEAFRLFDHMQQQGLQPNEVTYIGVLKACVVLKQGESVHKGLIMHGVELSVQIGSALVDMYVKCGCIIDARNVFDNLSQRNVITWSTMITGCIQYDLYDDAFKLFDSMQEQGIEPNEVTFLSTLKACAMQGNIQQGWRLHAQVIQSGLGAHIVVGNALIYMYSTCQSLQDTRVVFQRMQNRDVVSWTSMIGMYARDDALGLEGILLFEKMREDGIKPNSITYGYVLKLMSSMAALEQGRQIHACIVEGGLESTDIICNALIDVYSRCGRLMDALLTFQRVHRKTLSKWSALLNGCAQHGDYSLALEIFTNMLSSGLKPDNVVFLCLLSACKSVTESCRHFKSMRDDHGIIPRPEHHNSMVDVLGHAGCLDEAEDLLESNHFGANVVGWTSLLHSCKLHVNVILARRCFNHLVMLDPKTSAGYVLMSAVYSRAGMLHHAEEMEELRRKRIGWKKLAHAFIEVDNQVHNFAVGDKSHPKSADIYAKLDSLNVQMKAEGYAPCLDLVLGPMSQKEKEDTLCEHSEKLAIAFGLISSPHGATIRISKNLRMCGNCHSASKLISKIEMREIFVTDTYCIHRFQEGVCSCKDYSYQFFKKEAVQTLG